MPGSIKVEGVMEISQLDSVLEVSMWFSPYGARRTA